MQVKGNYMTKIRNCYIKRKETNQIKLYVVTHLMVRSPLYSLKRGKQAKIMKEKEICDFLKKENLLISNC